MQSLSRVVQQATVVLIDGRVGVTVDALGDLIRRTREDHGISPKQLALLIDRSPQYVSQLENNRIATPPPAVVGMLSEALHVPEVTLLAAMGYLQKSGLAESGLVAPEAERTLLPVIRSFDWTEEKLRAAAAALRAIGAMGNRPG